MSTLGPQQKALLGVWKSDRRRTLEACHRYHTLRGGRKRRFARFLGHLELRYTRKSVYHNLRGFRHRATYEVIAEDGDSIVIRVRSEDLKQQIERAAGSGFNEFFEPRLQHITFGRYRGRQYYWIGLGKYCEWFRKQGSQPAAAPNGGLRRRRTIRSSSEGRHR